MKKDNKKFWIIGGIIVVVVVIFLVYNSSNNSTSNFESQDPSSQNFQDANSKSSCREVEVPYEDVEDYPFQECSTQELSYSKKITLCETQGTFGFGDYRITCQVINTDSEGANFRVRLWGIKIYPSGSRETKEYFETRYIYPGTSEVFSHDFDVLLGLQSCVCDLDIVPTK